MKVKLFMENMWEFSLCFHFVTYKVNIPVDAGGFKQVQCKEYICWIQVKIHISDQTSLRICNSVGYPRVPCHQEVPLPLNHCLHAGIFPNPGIVVGVGVDVQDQVFVISNNLGNGFHMIYVFFLVILIRIQIMLPKLCRFISVRILNHFASVGK
jgi:hypothetical protein